MRKHLPVFAWLATALLAASALRAQLSVTPDPNLPGVSLRVTAGSAAVGQTIKTFNGRVQLASGSTTPVALYTVTTGKTFYVTDVNWSTASNSELDVQLQAAGTSIFRAAILNTSPCDATGIESQPTASTGSAVTILLPAASGTPFVDYFVAGYEQ